MRRCAPPTGGRSELPRAREVRDAYRLIGECRELGAEPAQWSTRMADGLRGLIGAPHATAGEGWPARAGRPIEQLSIFPSGLDPSQLMVLAAYARAGGPSHDPLFVKYPYACGRAVTRTWPQVLSDRVYRRSAAYDRYFRSGEVEHRLVTVHQRVAAAPLSVVHLSRPRGDRDFSARERALLDFFFQELGPLVGRALVSVAEPSPLDLSPRLRQTLAGLLEGDSEKQVAARLGVSATTTHQYVTALYRRFGVQSRAQLMALAFKRARNRAWSRFNCRA